MKRNRKWLMSLILAVVMVTGIFPAASYSVTAETPPETEQSEPAARLHAELDGGALILEISGEGLPADALRLVTGDPQAVQEAYESSSEHTAENVFLAELAGSDEQPVTLKGEGKLTVTVSGSKTGEYTDPVFLLWDGSTVTAVNAEKNENGEYTFEADSLGSLVILQNTAEQPEEEPADPETQDESGEELTPEEEEEEGAELSASPSFDYTYKLEWRDAESAAKQYQDAEHTAVKLIPANNATQTMTLNVSLDLKGDKSVEYPAGSITMAFPATYFEGWNPSDPLLIACENDSYSSKRVASLYWQIPKAPETNTLSSFNYTEETRTIDGKDIRYYVIKNHTLLTGGTVFSMAMTYYVRPTMVKVEHDYDRNVGVYNGGSLPIELKIDKDLDGTVDAEEVKNMSCSMETKVNESELEIKYETKSANKGVFFQWDNRWGAKPADAADYFYVIWYINYHRQGKSSQAYTYHLNIDEESLGAGEIVGARKYTHVASDAVNTLNQTYAGNRYDSYGNVTTNLDGTYAKIAASRAVLEAEWVGIPKNPTIAKTAYMDGYTGKATYDNYYKYSNTKNPYGGSNYQTYAVLVRYPNKVIDDAKAAGTDVVNDGVKLDFQASVTETWADGYTKTTEPFHPSDGRTVKVLEAPTGGGPGMNKQRYNVNQSGHGKQDFLEGWETFYAGGLNFSAHYTMTNNAISDVVKGSDGDYSFTGTQIQMTDGDYYLFTDLKNNNYAYGKKPGAENIAGGDPMKLIPGEDYDYTTFYMTESRWDASYNPALGIQRSSEPETNYTEFSPLEVWIRTQGSEEYTKFGQFVRAANGTYTFLFEDGRQQTGVTSDKRVAFPAHTTGVQIREDSPSYQTSTTFGFNVRYYSNERTQARVQKDLDNNLRCFVGGGAAGILSRGESIGKEQQLGTYWHRYSYTLNGVSYKTIMEKTSDTIVNDSKKSEQTSVIKAGFYYETNYRGNNLDLVSKFITKSGILYDLLPAGTYATDIRIGSRASGGGIETRFTSGYTVEQIENWEGSGQTMLKVTYTVPEGTKMWHTYWAGICLTYKLHNPYINIIDRGVHAMNTIGLVDTSPDDVIIRSQTSAAALPNSKIARKAYYQDLFTEANAQKFETGITEKDIVFKPVTVIEATFTNRVQTQSESGYEVERTAYLADTYDYRLRYTAQNATRTTNIVIYDVLDKDGEDEIGDFDWIDVSSISSKASYDKDHPGAGENCAPVVYYATTVPTKFNVDDSTVWTTECPADKTTVKAIAIDCRKTTGGKDFVLDQGGTMVGYVHCIASDNEDWAGRLNVNDAYLSAAFFVGDDPGDNPKTELIEDNSKVHLEKVVAEIAKAADPESGTAEEPALIPNNEEGKSYDGLTYTLTVKNNTESGLPAARSMIIEDVLPEGFTLNPKKEITLESAAWPIKAGTKISANNNVVDVLSGQNLTITVNNMPVQCELKITIPVTRAEKVVVPTDYQNTAKITKIGNLPVDLTSETTYHRTIPEFTLHYEVIPDEKYGEPKNGSVEHPADVLNIPYGTEETLADVLSATDTTADMLDESRTDVYGKWTFTGWCEDEACSEDPVKKVTITEDRTVYGKWEFTPYEVEFKKISSAKKEPLEGAEFALYGEDFMKDGKPDENAEPVEEGLVSDKDGLFSLKNPLSVGTYYLMETKAPEFYREWEEPLKLTVDAEAGMKLENQIPGTDRENPMKLTFLVENEYLFGDLVIEKNLEKWEDSSDATFVFSVKAVKDGETVFTDVASLTFDGPEKKTYTFTGVIPVGAEVTVREEYSGSVYKAVGADEVKVTVEKPSGAEDPATASFTNTYDGSGGNQGTGILNTFTKDGKEWIWSDDRPKEEQ